MAGLEVLMVGDHLSQAIQLAAVLAGVQPLVKLED
jgi:hypothetical protein